MMKLLGVTGAALLLVSTAAVAETADSDAQASSERRDIEYGSLAWRSPVLARDPSLIRSVEREELEATGRTDLGEALRRVPTVPQIRH